ncbi:MULTISPECIES: PTS glucitol/sorbitol transporter subunit IIA [unclassified Luteococcus]|uniref:PTS glucitol/sorbitol transporter subunit IIA n=1 Tax=unclassified Luteococcus TaxID=2639923 RepID=UPI00313EAEC7
MTEIYRTTVTDAGSQAGAFIADGLFVTFGENAPEALADYCFIIEMNQTTADLAVGQTFVVDGQRFPITAVGEAAQKNLNGLGHLTVNVDGGTEASLSGAIHIRCDEGAPQPGIGSVFSVEA